LFPQWPLELRRAAIHTPGFARLCAQGLREGAADRSQRTQAFRAAIGRDYRPVVACTLLCEGLSSPDPGSANDIRTAFLLAAISLAAEK